MSTNTRPYLIPQGKGRFIVKLEVKGGTRVIGKIENGCYYKHVSFEKHMMHKKRSIGFNKYMIERFFNIRDIVVSVDGTIFRTTREKVLKEGTEDTFEGYEPQLFLDIDKFN